MRSAVRGYTGVSVPSEHKPLPGCSLNGKFTSSATIYPFALERGKGELALPVLAQASQRGLFLSRTALALLMRLGFGLMMRGAVIGRT